MVMKKIEIRKARKEDLEGIWKIEVESRRWHKKITNKKYSLLNKSKTNNKSKTDFIKSFKKSLIKTKDLTLIAEKNNEIVGYITSKFGRWGWSDNPPKTIWIEDIGILKKYQRKGIAKKLLKETEKIAKRRGIKYSYLTVWLKNKAAYNFYKKNKFDDFAIEMVKKLK